MNPTDRSALDAINELVNRLAEPKGFELVDSDLFRKGGKRAILRIFIDKPGGITIEECARFSRELSTHLDVENIIEGSYMLEVSSPGTDRPFRTERDFARNMGKPVKVSLRISIDGSSLHTGVLVEKNADTVVVEKKDGKRQSFEFTDIASVKLNAEIK